jgi:chromosome segregation and condensation protein ScpB
MVKEEMTNMFIKNIREEAIKDTIKTLMKEGIIPAKKK